MASELRQDITSGEWVIISADRAKRPRFRPQPPETPQEQEPADDFSACPFCPEHERETPEASFVLPPGRASLATDWKVRVFQNKFPALETALDYEEPSLSATKLFPSLPGFGFHEVIVETPEHRRELFDLEPEQVSLILEAYQARFRHWHADDRIRMILLFRNYGVRSGATIPHPHSQLLALPVVPTALAHRLARAKDYFAATGRNLYEALVEEEKRQSVRVVFETEHFLVFSPYAPRSSFETWVFPKKARPNFGEVSSTELRDLAGALRNILRRLERALKKPHYNYVIYSAPLGGPEAPVYSWHLKIFPRLIAFAGFEIGSGMGILALAPEEMARTLREAF